MRKVNPCLLQSIRAWCVVSISIVHIFADFHIAAVLYRISGKLVYWCTHRWRSSFFLSIQRWTTLVLFSLKITDWFTDRIRWSYISKCVSVKQQWFHSSNFCEDTTTINIRSFFTIDSDIIYGLFKVSSSNTMMKAATGSVMRGYWTRLSSTNANGFHRCVN
jgi:hypothetical protein